MISHNTTYDSDLEKLITDWEALKGERAHIRTSAASKNRIGTVIQFIGLPYDDEKQLNLRREGRPGNRWMYFTLQVDPTSVGILMGSAQFGTQANGTYHIFCFWEDARPDLVLRNPTIRNLAQDNKGAVIALYLKTMTEAERQDFRRISWAHGVTVACLDQGMLAFLAASTGDRFQDFLGLSLPFTAANPYNPVTTGWGARVAPEMFYGRERLARDIAAMRDGTSLIFGGRQLGKTALLRRVEETFTQPDLRHFAWFIDLKDIGYVQDNDSDNSKDPGDILKVLYDMFLQHELFDEEEDREDWELMRQEILDAFVRDRDLHVLVMFDESDAFLWFDWNARSRVVESLRALMADTNNRFKVVFAGLHNVQRFANRPNNPFPNLGYDPNTPRRGGIGPLRDYDARNLVEQPFHLLGFKFEPLVVDKILSYTNRHPSLIQFFCHELIESHRRSNVDNIPPFEIGVEDVDRVYRTPRIQGGIKRRFEATFELDPRYHVIALTMILFQESPTETWTLEKVRSYCQTACPLTFDSEYLSDLELEALLNELVGLGVLGQDGEFYRMRSSLIGQMFGSANEVNRTLADLEAREPFEVS